MSKRSDEKYLADVLQYAREARELATGLDEQAFHRDRRSQLALAYLVQIIGEAASQMTDAKRAELPELPWHEMAGTRHRLVHDYRNVSFAVVWKIVNESLPDLIAALERFTPPEPPSA